MVLAFDRPESLPPSSLGKVLRQEEVHHPRSERGLHTPAFCGDTGTSKMIKDLRITVQAVVARPGSSSSGHAMELVNPAATRPKLGHFDLTISDADHR